MVVDQMSRLRVMLEISKSNRLVPKVSARLAVLKGTELLTLGACQTAQETNSDTEGIVKVAYIFERAGAQAVMASLWSVDDDATHDLMIDFYKNLKLGMTKGQALQHAKFNQIQRHPYFWSSFILIGDAY